MSRVLYKTKATMAATMRAKEATTEAAGEVPVAISDRPAERVLALISANARVLRGREFWRGVSKHTVMVPSWLRVLETTV